jgi:hypothetical protein
MVVFPASAWAMMAMLRIGGGMKGRIQPANLSNFAPFGALQNGSKGLSE